MKYVYEIGKGYLIGMLPCIIAACAFSAFADVPPGTVGGDDVNPRTRLVTNAWENAKGDIIAAIKVKSVNGKTGDVTLDADDVGAVPRTFTINGTPLSGDGITIEGMTDNAMVFDANGGEVKTHGGDSLFYVEKDHSNILTFGKFITYGNNTVEVGGNEVVINSEYGKVGMWSGGFYREASGMLDFFFLPFGMTGIIALENAQSLSAMLDDANTNATARVSIGEKVMTLIDTPVQQKINNAVNANMNTYVDGETGIEYVGKYYGGNLYYVPTGNVYPPNN